MTRAMPNDVYAVVLAGGSGTRFWPKSRQRSPKQLCALGGSDKTMLEVTLARLDGFIPPERRVIITHKDQVEATKRIVGATCRVIIAEPEARNTANALALAALEIEHLHGSPHATLISLHADSVIQKVDVMLDVFRTAVEIARKGSLTLVGIVPRYPETGYGYIERGLPLGFPGAYHVNSFREKPNRTVAEEFVQSKRFYWNAGMFVFPVALFLEEFQAKLPASLEALRSLQKVSGSFQNAEPTKFSETYSKLPKISVDHAILEVSEKVSVVEADIGWQDVGSWDALGSCFKTDAHGNFVEGDVLSIDSKNCTFDTDGPLIAALGLDDIVVVHAKGAILVCPKSRSQDVKTVVDRLKDLGRSEFI